MQVKAKTRSNAQNGAPGTRNRAVLGQLSDMDLRLLQVFKSVVDCGGMAAAELELNIGTSTVSRHVKDLETRLGLVLCRQIAEAHGGTITLENRVPGPGCRAELTLPL